MTRRIVLPRRWNVKYIGLSLAGVYVLYCVAFNMPFLSSKLPKYSGRYDVGVIDIEAPVEKRTIANALLKDTRQPAFDLETVLFSLYYPAAKSSMTRKLHHDWLPKPLHLTAEGYARAAHMENVFANKAFTFALWMLAGSTTIPAKVDVPLHGARSAYTEYKDYDIERPLDEYGLPQFPVIVFSHGMAASRTSSTQYCAELASRGFVVAAVEHRDGSAPATVVMKHHTEPRAVRLLRPEDLEPVPEYDDFRSTQLAMRQAEIQETVRILGMINSGRGHEVYEENARAEGRELKMWEGRLNTNRIVVGGHSFGATLALQALKGAPSEKLPFVAGIVLDPGKHSGPLNDEINVPLLIVHSQSWSARHSVFHGRPHFEVVRDLVKKVNEEKKKFAWFATSKGTAHWSITDAPLIEPLMLWWTTGASLDARDGVLQYVKISRQFMYYLDTGHRQSILQEDVTHPEYDETEGIRPYDPNVSKYWQIHVAPTNRCPTIGYCGLEEGDGEKSD